MAEDWGIKISKKGVDVKQALTSSNKKDFVIVSTDSCLRIQKAEYNTYDQYIVTILTEISVPMTFTFEPDNKTNPTIWDIY